MLWSGCARATALVCTAAPGLPLPEEIVETSGAAWSGREAGLFWTHNDGREGVLYAVDTTGALRARVELEGARIRDAEDLAAAPCGDSHCLYLADTGDNQERRSTVQILRLEEPTLEARAATVDRFPVSFPGGPRDVEALVVLSGERIYLVSKGRREPITVYRYPGPLQPDSLVVLEPVRALDDDPPAFASRISGASAVPGRDDLLLIRSYERLRLVEMGEDGPTPYPDGELNLIPLLEAQGEAVAVRADGRVILTSEAGPLTPMPGMRLLQCTFPPERTSGG
ncbi:MAG: hypothetical protein JSU98_04865 [Gemmatimonadales bacterium]|jgi:hypothetical protein|nr:MAG: hypothetical protein JSU98_04865 [Gemmatimonadales bacterium]